MTTVDEPAGRWTHTYKLLDRAGPFAGETFEPDTPEAPKVTHLLATAILISSVHVLTNYVVVEKLFACFRK